MDGEADEQKREHGEIQRHKLPVRAVMDHMDDGNNEQKKAEDVHFAHTEPHARQQRQRNGHNKTTHQKFKRPHNFTPLAEEVAG
jgi:hypothetical protein